MLVVLFIEQESIVGMPKPKQTYDIDDVTLCVMM